MRIVSWALIIAALFAAAAQAQTLSAGFQFPATVKPGDELTVTGAGLGAIAGVALKSPGKPDLVATNVTAAPASVRFTVPPATPNGNYTVALTPGSLPPIPLTIAAPPSAATAPTTTPSTASPPPAAPDVYMPDGQLQSHAILVYLARNIELEQQPCLRLNRSHEITKETAQENECYRPMQVISGHKWNQTERGQEIEKQGTLLMFDLKQLKFSGKAIVRVRPVVEWNEAGKRQVAAGPREVNLGSSFWIFVWTGIVVAAALLIIALLSARAKGNALYLLIGAEGRLSLAQTQIALWTLAVGSIVLGYGMLRLEIPTIPNSLLALMGASLATGGLGFIGDVRKLAASADEGAAPLAPPATPATAATSGTSGSAAAPALAPVPAQARSTAAPGPLALRNLVLVFPPAEGALSLSKAQMLFWTILLLTLFVSKSLLDGAIWEVPWALVALMGFSQAGFVVPKLAESKPQPPQPPAAPQPGQP
ncbi:MAG: hypothetical protein C5B56_11285 [Proteobacteria bacterium]|nr:MAG: hypothetical protein C5B56_11285 [Pseudomonadota bacterium]